MPEDHPDEGYSDILKELDKEEKDRKLRMKIRRGEDLGPAMCVTPFAVAPTQEEDIAEDKAFQEFMKGYTRDVHMMAKVLSALAKAMDKYPHLRLGQLLYVVIQNLDSKNGKIGDELSYMRNFHLRLFNIYDEEVIRAIEAFD
jgi:hypothetical protein